MKAIPKMVWRVRLAELLARAFDVGSSVMAQKVATTGRSLHDRPDSIMTPVSEWTTKELEDRILWAKDGVLALNKCPDLPTTGRSLEDPDCLQWRLIQHMGSMVWSAHQLDADTSGVCMFTTEKRLVEPLKRAMSGPDSAKVYTAFVRGQSDWDVMHCDAPVGPIDERSLGVTDTGKSARSQITVLNRFPMGPHPGGDDSLPMEGASEWLVRIETGRTHQIRIHASHLGHPLLGEEWYSDPPCKVHPRQALHAGQLQLGPPFHKEVLAPLPSDLVQLRQRLSGGHFTSS